MSARKGAMRGAGLDDELRRRIALEAARLMSEHGIRDFHLAKRKAAAHFHLGNDALLPGNREIDEALRAHQRLFQADEQPEQLRHLREIAREALRFFARFEPRLVGAVLDGSADRHSAVCLHLFNDTPEDVVGFLLERAIDYVESSRLLRMNADTQREFPVLLFSADDASIDLTILPRDAIRQAPLDRVDARPLQRASLSTLEQLLAE